MDITENFFNKVTFVLTNKENYMKRILIIAAALFTNATAFSQEDSRGGNNTFSMGPSVGVGHTGVRNTVGTAMFKPAWSAGLIFNYSSSQHIGISADVLWSFEGGLTDYIGTESDLDLEYIRIPLKFVYYFGSFEDDFRPKLTIGPSMGFLLNADSYVEGFGTTDVTSMYEMFDIGLNASAGLNWKIQNNVWLNADLNYYTGFTAIRADHYNNNLGLKIGMAFGL